jgi:hypothetical protein
LYELEQRFDEVAEELVGDRVGVRELRQTQSDAELA